MQKGWMLIGAALLAGCRPGGHDPPRRRDPGETADRAISVSIDLDSAVAQTSPRFLSFAIDIAALVRREPYDFSRARLRRMTSGLAPAYLRIGGTAADRTYYDLSDAPVGAAPQPFEKVLTRDRWDAAAGFAHDLGLEVVFTLNAGPGPRDPLGQWTPDNAEELVEYTAARGYPVATWELGNEINFHWADHGLCLDAEDYARDFAAARSLVDAAHPRARLAGPSNLFWPVWGEPPPIGCDFSTTAFLALAGDLVDVVAWHYYPQQSDAESCVVRDRPADVDTLFDAANLDAVLASAQAIRSARDESAPDAEAWLTETGHALCGGQDGLSDTFASSFWWLDQLGLLAKRGQKVVVRQTLTGGSYDMIDSRTLEPNPDYWSSLLWKRLMGTRALDLAVDAGPALRAYAHCAADRAGPVGAVTVLLINLGDEETRPLAIGRAGGARELYQVTGRMPSSLGECLDDPLTVADERPDDCSELVVNGVTLQAADDGSPPPIEPAFVEDPIRLAPRSYAFVVLTEADAPACLIPSAGG